MTDLTHLQALLRESKATSARSQQMLNDPDGAALITKAQDLLEHFVEIGDSTRAEQAYAILADLHEKEAALHRAERGSSDAQDEGVRVIVDDLNRRGDT